MKKTLILMLCMCGYSFAGTFDSLTSTATSLNNSNQCISSCDQGAIMKALNVPSEQATKMSKNACQVACANQCFADQINNKATSETAAKTCKDSLKSSLAMK